jgi:uncharacterized Zn finger protein
LPNWEIALSDASLREEAGATVFQRGQTYAASGAVQDSELTYPEQGACIELRATVMGTQRYTCEVWVRKNDEVEGDCDCPHSLDGYFCKHQVALALTLRGLLGGDAPVHDAQAQKKVAAAAKRAQTQAGNRETLKVFVQGQSAAMLADRLWQWAERDSDLMADLKVWAAQSRATDDPKTIKTVISELLKSSGFLDWRESGVYAHRAAKVLPLLEKALVVDSTQARILCEHALRRVYKACEEADDSNGDIGGVIERLMDLLMHSLQAVPPPASWLDDWFDLMQADPWGLWREMEVLEAAGAAVQERYSQRAAKDWHAWVASHRTHAQASANEAKKPGNKTIRVISTTSAHHFDYERTRLRCRYLDDLKRQGDTQNVIDVMRNSLESAHEHSELVAYCETLGKNREALQFAQVAYKLYPTDWRSEGDLLRCYERDGWDEEALTIRRRQLEKSPTVEHYKATLKAAKAAGRDMAAYREELFTWVQAREIEQGQRVMGGRPSVWGRSVPGVAGRHVGTRAQWLLADGKLDEALALVQPPHVCEPALLHAMALKLPLARYAEAVPLLLRVFAVTMPGASTPYKNELTLVAETASRMQQPERGQWLALLRAEYKAKRNFIRGLEAIEIPA